MSSGIKYAKYIPPEIEFKGDITKMKIVSKVVLGYTFASRPMYFLGYFVCCINKGLSFYNMNTYNLVFQANFAEGEEEILAFKKIDEDTLIITNDSCAKIIRFYENEPKKITFEVIQEFKDTEFRDKRYIDEIIREDVFKESSNGTFSVRKFTCLDNEGNVLYKLDVEPGGVLGKKYIITINEKESCFYNV